MFDQYGRPKKCPQKVLVTYFLNIFHVKTKWNIAYEYLKTEIFSRDTNIPPQMHWTSNIFEHSAITIGCFWVWLSYPILNFKKTVLLKNVWIRHCSYVTNTEKKKNLLSKITSNFWVLNTSSKSCFKEKELRNRFAIRFQILFWNLAENIKQINLLRFPDLKKVKRF